MYEDISYSSIALVLDHREKHYLNASSSLSLHNLMHHDSQAVQFWSRMRLQITPNKGITTRKHRAGNFSDANTAPRLGDVIQTQQAPPRGFNTSLHSCICLGKEGYVFHEMLSNLESEDTSA